MCGKRKARQFCCAPGVPASEMLCAPVLIIAGENDSRCPVEGITPWVDAVRANGVEVRVHWYPTGHHANATEDQVRHMRMILDFFAEHGGPPTPAA